MNDAVKAFPFNGTTFATTPSAEDLTAVTLTGVSPRSGPTAGGTSITLTGTYAGASLFHIPLECDATGDGVSETVTDVDGNMTTANPTPP